MRNSTPAPRSSSQDVDFDLAKVNRLRSLVKRGGYTIDPTEVADSLLSEHLMWSTLFDPIFMDEEVAGM